MASNSWTCFQTHDSASIFYGGDKGRFLRRPVLKVDLVTPHGDLRELHNIHELFAVAVLVAPSIGKRCEITRAPLSWGSLAWDAARNVVMLCVPFLQRDLEVPLCAMHDDMKLIFQLESTTSQALPRRYCISAEVAVLDRAPAPLTFHARSATGAVCCVMLPNLASEPTPTATPAATPKPEPTATLAATPKPEPTLAATPKPEPTLAATPKPEPTLAATAAADTLTATPADTSKPEPTPKAEAAPEDEAALKPEPASKPEPMPVHDTAELDAEVDADDSGADPMDQPSYLSFLCGGVGTWLARLA